MENNKLNLLKKLFSFHFIYLFFIIIYIDYLSFQILNEIIIIKFSIHYKLNFQ